MRLFGTSGIRGVVGEELTPDFCYQIGQAIGTVIPVQSQVCIATDARLSRDMVKDAVTDGLLSAGIHVTHLGMLPTPTLAFLTREMGFTTGLMITASHNPPEYNGIKVFNADTVGYSLAQEDEIESVYRSGQFRDDVSRGTLYTDRKAKEIYRKRLLEMFSPDNFNRDLRVVVDPGNGAASGFASELFATLGINVIPTNDIPDGHFPGRPSEPNGDTLQGTVEFLRRERAHLAVCFDGDADRVVFCDEDGFLGLTEMVAFVSRMKLQHSSQKKVAATIEVGKLLDLAVQGLGADVVRGKVGDVHLAHLVKEHHAAIGVENAGVYVIPEMGMYPESLFASLMVLQNISSPKDIRAFIGSLPRFYTARGKLPCPNELKSAATERIIEKVDVLGPMTINTLDGVRLDNNDSWILIRASGTEPILRIRTESTNQTKAQDLLDKGHQLIEEVLSSLMA